MNLIKRLLNLLEERDRLEEKVRALRDELFKILDEHKWDVEYVRANNMYLNYRYVLNKAKMRYHYYYLVIRDRRGNLKKNMYLGKLTGKELEKVKILIKDFRRAKGLLKELRRAKRELEGIEGKMRRIEKLLS